MRTHQEITQYNKQAWNREVELGNQWTVPISPQEIEAARQGEFTFLLTRLKPVPKHWFPPLAGCLKLCLASGGGQQGALLTAAGANVTVLDNFPAQLARDREVAEREGLSIRLV